MGMSEKVSNLIQQYIIQGTYVLTIYDVLH